MGLSGLIGANVGEGIEDLLQQQLMQQQMAERVRAQQAQEEQQRERLAFDRERFSADQAQAGLENEDRDTERRERANRAGVADMERQAGLMRDAEAAARRQQVIDALSPRLRPEALRKLQLVGPEKMTADELMSEEDLAAAEARKIASIGREEAERAKYRKPSGDGGFTLNEGDTRFDAKGNKIASVPKQATAGGSGGGVGGEYTAERHKRTRDAATDLLNRTSGMTTGFGSLLSMIPATDARTFEARLNTLKANIAFNELAEMRAASKTGGALGAVSDKELALLESALGALDTGQKPSDFKSQMTQVISSLDRFDEAKRLAASGGNRDVNVVPPPSGGQPLTKEQVNPRTGARRTVISMDGGKTWQAK